MDSSMVPAIYDRTLADRELRVSTEDAYRMVRRAAREEGLFVGISAGAAIVATIQLARDLSKGILVTILCDGGDKYLSEKFWEDDFS